MFEIDHNSNAFSKPVRYIDIIIDIDIPFQNIDINILKAKIRYCVI
jgi:hypothetical protein